MYLASSFSNIPLAHRRWAALDIRKSLERIATDPSRHVNGTPGVLACSFLATLRVDIIESELGVDANHD